MTRREFIPVLMGAIVPGKSRTPLIIPLHVIIDKKSDPGPRELTNFWAYLWPQAAMEFIRSGIQFRMMIVDGEVWRPPGRQPVISGLQPGAINMVVTGRIPMVWDSGRSLSGVTTLYRGYHLCMVALDRAHGNQAPLLSVNTCVHELLHVLLHDIFEDRPPGLRGQAREFLVDCYATRLWLFHDGGAIRSSAETYLERLRRDSLALTR